MKRKLNSNIHKIKKGVNNYFYNFDNDLSNKAKSIDELNQQISQGVANISIIEVGIIEDPNEIFNIEPLERFTHFDIDFNTNTVSLNKPEDYLGKYIIIYRKAYNSQPNINMFGDDGNADFSFKNFNENSLGILYNLQDVEANAKFNYINKYNYAIDFNFKNYLELEIDLSYLENLNLSVKEKSDDIIIKYNGIDLLRSNIYHYDNALKSIYEELTQMLEDFNDNQQNQQQAIQDANQVIQDCNNIQNQINSIDKGDMWQLSQVLRLPSSVAEQYKERLIKPDGVERDYYDKQMMYLKEVYPVNMFWDFTLNNNNTLNLYTYTGLTERTPQVYFTNKRLDNLYRLMGNRLFIYSPYYALRSQDVNDLTDYWLYVYDTNLETLVNNSVDGNDIDFSQFQMVLSKRISLLGNLTVTRHTGTNYSPWYITRDGNYILKSDTINQDNISINYSIYRVYNGLGFSVIDLNDPSFSPSWHSLDFDVSAEDQALGLDSPLKHVIKITADDIPSYFYDKTPGDLDNAYIQYIQDSVYATVTNSVISDISIFSDEEIIYFVNIHYRAPSFLGSSSSDRRFSTNSIPKQTAMALKVNLKTKKIKSKPLLVLNGLNPFTQDYNVIDTDYEVIERQTGISDLRGMEFRGKTFYNGGTGGSSLVDNPSFPFSNYSKERNDYSGGESLGDKYISNNNIKTDDVVGDNFKVFFTNKIISGATYPERGEFICYSINKNTGEIVEVTNKTRNDFLTEFNIPTGSGVGRVDQQEYTSVSRSLCSDEFTIIQVRNSVLLFLWEDGGVVKHRWVRLQNDLFTSSSATTITYDFEKYKMIINSNALERPHNINSPSHTNVPNFIRHIKGNKFLCLWSYDILDSSTNAKLYDGLGLQFEITKDIKNGTGILDLTLSEDVFNDNLKPTSLTHNTKIVYSSSTYGVSNTNYMCQARTTPSGEPVFIAKGFDYLDEVDPNDGSYIVRFLIQNYKIDRTVRTPFIPDDLNDEYKNYIVKAPDMINIEGTDLDGEFIEI